MASIGSLIEMLKDAVNCTEKAVFAFAADPMRTDPSVIKRSFVELKVTSVCYHNYYPARLTIRW